MRMHISEQIAEEWKLMNGRIDKELTIIAVDNPTSSKPPPILRRIPIHSLSKRMSEVLDPNPAPEGLRTSSYNSKEL